MANFENLKEKNRSEQVNIVASHILQENGCIRESKAMTGKDLYGKYKTLQKSEGGDFVDIPQTTFCQMLSLLSQQPSSVSCIKSAEGKNGYYIDLNLNADDVDAKNNSKKVDIKIKEQDLYDSIRLWLSTKCRVSEDISTGRKGEKWQNVDVLGLAPYSYLGVDYLDVYSVEVKLSMDNWRKDLFEAVSHSMFANYSYFAFMIKASDVDKIDGDLKIYAHNFNVGLLAIAVDDKKWDAVMQQREKISLDGNGKHANAKIIEISIAPEHQVSKRLQGEFLKKVMDIDKINDVYTKFESGSR